MSWIFWVLVFSVPLFGIVYAGFTSFLKYRQHRAMLDVLKVYAERGETPPQEVLTALTNGFSLAEAGVNAPNTVSGGSPKVQGPVHYWSLVALFAVFAVGFGYAASISGVAATGYMIVSFTMGAVMVWALVMALFLTFKK